MRGLVMLLMAVDHSSDAYNAGRVFTDSVNLYHPGAALPVAQFLVRWVTHLCAPTFLFLAGTGLAFTVRKELSRGKTQASVDRYLLTRGLVIAGSELWISLFVMPRGMYLFQVLYAIGTSYLLMIPLRRLPNSVAFGLGVALVLLLELVCGLTRLAFGEQTPLWATLLILPHDSAHLIVGYPTLHWLALMLLGWGFGNYLLDRPAALVHVGRKLGLVGVASLGVFLVVRGLNGYGNMRLLRADGSLVQWLHVSKYPPSLTYILLELGICFVCLAGFFALAKVRPPKPNHLLMVLGQTPMFFYLLHFPMLVESAHFLRVESKLGLGATLLAAASVIAILYPACRAYRSYKSAHKRSWARYI